MKASEARALVDSKPERDAEELREYHERRLKKTYDHIEQAARAGSNWMYVEDSWYTYQALVASGYACRRNISRGDMFVSWEDPQ
jgi:hypothetical protein